MKYMLVFAVLFVAIWVWRKNRRAEADERSADRANERRTPKAAPPRVGAPQPMSRCAHCGLHLPAQDAVHANGHAYCSSAHRQAAGG